MKLWVVREGSDYWKSDEYICEYARNPNILALRVGRNACYAVIRCPFMAYTTCLVWKTSKALKKRPIKAN